MFPPAGPEACRVGIDGSASGAGHAIGLRTGRVPPQGTGRVVRNGLTSAERAPAIPPVGRVPRRRLLLILSDGTIRRLLAEERIALDPLDERLIQPASVDVRLGNSFLAFRRHTASDIDPWEVADDLMEPADVPEGKPFILHPGEFVLGTTLERLTLPDDIVARIEGKSSLGRLGLLIHATAGFVDPGWTRGQITLELSNVAPLPIRLWPGMKIAQLSFIQMDAAAERPYGHPDLGSKYQGQSGPVASRYRKNRPEEN